MALGDFATYVLIDPTNVLDAQTAFVTISLINVMNFPLNMMPIALMYGVMVSNHVLPVDPQCTLGPLKVNLKKVHF